MRLTNEQVDALETPVHAPTPERLEIRLEWGLRAGRAAYTRGCEIGDNPFTPMPKMPMHKGWRAGWLEALKADFDGKIMIENNSDD